MKSIILNNISKNFDGFQAVNNMNLQIEKGEFISFLGPSGCGKTTTLRMLAGFIPSDSGSIEIGDRLVDSKDINLTPEKRNVGMVFQSYAVWPHMNVFKNIAYPLKLKKLPKDTIKNKVKEAMDMVGLEGLDKRYPSELSGGQQQRVALARALVMEPELLLLDEPLSNLDAKLREKMRRDIRNIQRKENLTIVFVTHDQEEAITMSDRIVVMNRGEVQQIGTPEEVYNTPANEFVAKFIGRSNIVTATGEENGIFLKDTFISTDNKLPLEDLRLCIRPEDIELVEEGSSATVKAKEFLGNRFEYILDVAGTELLVESKLSSYEIGSNAKIKIKQASII